MKNANLQWIYERFANHDDDDDKEEFNVVGTEDIPWYEPLRVSEESSGTGGIWSLRW